MALVHHPDCNPFCRACHYKELDYASQLGRKQQWAARQLAPWNSQLREIVPAPELERLGYRSKSWLRASKSEGRLSLGMTRSIRVQGKWEEEFISWDRCPLHAEAIRQMIARLREALPFPALEGIWFGSPHVVVITKTPDLPTLDWSSLLIPPFTRAWHHCNSQVGTHVFSHLPFAQLAGPPPDPGMAPIKAFRQAAQTLLLQARNTALQHLLRTKPSQILDLYCGTGDLSLGLPPETQWLGIEQTRQAAEFAATLRPRNQAFTGNVEHRLADPQVRALIRKSPALYLNPPRSGLSSEARERILELIRERRPASIAYLSCSASSLARDLPALETAGFRTELLQPYDFFPQTEHFETLALLSGRSAP